MKHPFEQIPGNLAKAIFGGLFILTLLLMVLMNLIGAPLETAAAPYGIISYELAGNSKNALKILASWGEIARQKAAFSLGLDYLFMVVYSTTIGLGCILAGRAMVERDVSLGKVGLPLAWGQWAAAGLDALENIGLVLILFGWDAQLWAPLSRWCAILKFSLIFLGITYSLLGLALSIGLKPKTRPLQ